MSKAILFHCLFGGEYGWGHVVRCSALAEEAQARGYLTHLWSTRDAGQLPDNVKKHFSSVVTTFSPLDYSALILDNLKASQKEVSSFWPIGKAPVVVLDDEGKRDLSFADIIINPALEAERFHYPSSSQLCLGEPYALLRKAFQPISQTLPRKGLAITLGGTDVLNLAPTLLEHLGDSKYVDWPITLITPKREATEQAIEKHLQTFKEGNWLQQASADEIALAFRSAELGITACGGTAYEMAACQLPFVGIVVAENQQHFSSVIEKTWRLPILNSTELEKGILMKSLQSLQGHSAPFSQVDGLGAQRVIEMLSKYIARQK